MFSRLLARWRQTPPIASVGDLADFLDRSAAQIAQKSVIGYCLVKTQLPLAELTRDQRFAEAFDRSRWEAYAAVLADLIVVTEMYLRPAAGSRAGDLVGPLSRLYAAILARHPAPVHRPEGWEALAAAMPGRLAGAALAEPSSIARVAETSADRLFETLPIHERLREPDKPAIVANVQFLMVGLARRFDSGLERDALVGELLAAHEAAA